MDRKHKIEVIVATTVLVTLCVVLVIFLISSKNQKDKSKVAQPVVIEEILTPEQVAPTGVPARNKEAEANVIARSFVERFGSFSSQANYVNINDVKLLATEGLKERLDSIALKAKSVSGGAYYGVSTKVIAVEELTKTDAVAEFKMKTQRQETIDFPSNMSIRYQDIMVDLVKVGDRWLVSDFVWK